MNLNMQYLTFSDGAKYADIARNIVSGLGDTSSFNFWATDNSAWIQPVTPYSMAIVFKLLGVSDFSVILTTMIYFLLSLFFVYLLTNSVYKDKLTSVLATIAVGFNYNLINYATSGASESPFIFELLAGIYFLTLKKKWANFVSLMFMFLIYFTRPQAIVYIFGLFLFYFLYNYDFKKGTFYTFVSFALGTIFYLFFSRRGLTAVSQTLPGVAVSESLRGGNFEFGLVVLFKKLFYNLYNFYKSLPEIGNPYLFGLFTLGIFNWQKDKLKNVFIITSVFLILTTFVVTALTIPFYRYIHPIIPLIYIIAVGTLVEILRQFVIKKWLPILASSLVLFLCVGQTIGILVLDSRFEKKINNFNMPPIYVQMSYKLKEVSTPDQTILTNLDTWGSWYGERNTIWFPLKPKMIIDHQDDIDAIYLTSYKIDDENYYMSEDWREIFLNPENQTILPDYKFAGEYEFKSEDNYEMENGRAILLIKK